MNAGFLDGVAEFFERLFNGTSEIVEDVKDEVVDGTKTVTNEITKNWNN